MSKNYQKLFDGFYYAKDGWRHVIPLQQAVADFEEAISDEVFQYDSYELYPRAIDSIREWYFDADFTSQQYKALSELPPDFQSERRWFWVVSSIEKAVKMKRNRL